MKILRVAGATLLVIFGIWAGIRAYHRGHEVAVAAISVPVGEASPPSPSDFEPDPEVPGPRTTVPDRLPDFSLGDRNGKLVSISTWTGKSLVLNFWATWCPPCRREIPLLEAIDQEWSHREVVVLGVAVDHRDKVRAFADELKVQYPLLIGEEDALDVAGKFGVTAPVFPFTVFTDRRGEVVTLYIGELHRAQADLILNAVDRVNSNQIALADARRSIAEGLSAISPSG